MFSYKGGNNVRQGFYWNARTWAPTMIEQHGGRLPGGSEDRYARVPVLLMLLVAPAMGALYVIFLPVVGFVMVLNYVGRRVTRVARDGAVHLLAAMSPHWQPGAAYLAERRRRKMPEPKEPKAEGKAETEEPNAR